MGRTHVALEDEPARGAGHERVKEELQGSEDAGDAHTVAPPVRDIIEAEAEELGGAG